MHYKLSVTDFNKRHLLFRFLSGIFATAHTHTEHSHNLSLFSNLSSFDQVDVLEALHLFTICLGSNKYC